MDRNDQSINIDCTSVRVVGAAEIKFLLRTCRRERREPSSDAADRRAVPAPAILRVAADDSVAARAGLYSQSQARVEIDAADGTGCNLSETKALTTSAGAADLSVFTQESANNQSQPGVVYGHNLHSPVSRLYLSGGRDRLVLAICSFVGGIDLVRNLLLFISARVGVEGCSTRDLQYRSRFAVHLNRFHFAAGNSQNTNQHGRPRKSPRQRLRGAIMALGKVRGYLSQRLSRCERSDNRYRPLLQILQPRETAPGALVSHTGGSMVSRGLAFARQAVKELRPLRGAMLVPRMASLTARLAAAKYSIWAAAAAPFQWQGSTLRSPIFCPMFGVNFRYFAMHRITTQVMQRTSSGELGCVIQRDEPR